MNQKLNRLHSQRNKLTNLKRSDRTRTLIQLGGLLVKSGLVEKLGIEIGEDLQKQEDLKRKSCQLLGFLNHHLSFFKEEALEEFEEKGKKLFSEKTEEDRKNEKGSLL